MAACSLALVPGESYSFAGPPITLLPFLLVARVPTDVVVLVFVLGAAACSLWVLRTLNLPVWWILFPPIAEGIWVGNLNIFVIGLLVLGGTISGAVAIAFKAYSALPLILAGRWRPLVMATLIIVITAPFLPWADFIEDYGVITERLAEQSWGGRGESAVRAVG